MNNQYKVLSNNLFVEGQFSIVPIRFEDRLDIMKWRNEQIYHLRQNKPLTEEDQTNYFTNIVSKLFDQDFPNQILFSFLQDGKCIGYGGLVHINWIDKNAEISFIMNTELEKEFFEHNWLKFLILLEQVAFSDLKLHKIFTYAFDLRPHLYEIFIKSGFVEEVRLKEHCFFENKYLDVVIHSKINCTYLRLANETDIDITYKWATDSIVRKYSFNKGEIKFEEHTNWFKSKINNSNCIYLILCNDGKKIGSIRYDIESESALISYLIDSNFHGNGYGKKILELGEQYLIENYSNIRNVFGFVLNDNIASVKIFEKCQYTAIEQNENQMKFEKKINLS